MSRAIEVDTKTFIRFWLVVLGIVTVSALLLQALTGILIVLASIFFAVALRPLARRIDSIDKRKDRKNFSSVMAVIVVVSVILAALAFVGPIVVSETSKFLDTAPEQISNFLNSDTVNNFGNKVGIPDLKDQIVNGVKESSQAFLAGFSQFTFSSIGTIANVFTAVVLIVVLTILFMLQGPELLDHFWTAVSGKNKKAGKVWRRVFSRMANVIAKYVSGQLIVAILDGVIVATIVLALSIIFGFSANLAIPMGLVASFFYLIPMFGPIITAILVTLLLAPSSLWASVIFAAFYTIYAQFENNLISPKIQGKGMALPPLLILVSVTIGIYAFGLIGCVIAIPVAGCIKVLVEEYPAIKSTREE